MRWLIGLYVTLGTAYLLLATAAALYGAFWLSSGGRGKGGPGGGEAIVLSALMGVAAGVLLLTAYGLWQRWRIVRLVLLGISWWSLAVSTVTIVIAVGGLAGLVEVSRLGLDDPPGQTLTLALGLAVFAAWQAWVLTRPGATESFRSPRQPTAPISRSERPPSNGGD